MPNPSATTDAWSRNFAKRLLSLRYGCVKQRPKTIPPMSAIGGDTAPVAAMITPIKKMVLASFMGRTIRRIGLQTVVMLSTCQAGGSHNRGDLTTLEALYRREWGGCVVTKVTCFA